MVRTAPSHQTKLYAVELTISRFSNSLEPSSCINPMHSASTPSADAASATLMPLPAATLWALSTRFSPPGVKCSTCTVRSMLGLREIANHDSATILFCSFFPIGGDTIT